MEEDVGFLAAERHIGRGARLNWVGRCSDILIVSIFLAGLVCFCLDGSVLPQVRIWYR
jgi:hypothetical protein